MWWEEINLHTFLSLILEGREWSNSHPGHSIHWDRDLNVHVTQGSVGHKVDLGILEMRTTSFLCQTQPQYLGHQAHRLSYLGFCWQ